MGAKFIALALAALLLGGCAINLKKLAPPGIVKYEDRAKGEPVDPAIAARIAERKALPGEGAPDLSKAPQTPPATLAAPERAALEATLTESRDALAAAIEADKALADGERPVSIEIARETLESELAADDAAARRERGLQPRAIDEAPAPEVEQ